MTTIFISYSRKDAPLAEFVAQHLRNRGADVFIDYQKIVGGDDFMTRLGKEIERSDFVVLLVSPRSMRSKWVRAEISWAFTCDKRIVPVLLEEPPSYEGAFVVATLHHIDFTRWSTDGRVEDAIGQLVASLGLPAQPLQQNEPEPRLMSGTVPDEEPDTEAEAPPVNFARQDLSEMFFAALESREENPEEAVFLLQQVIDNDPNFMSGQAQDYIQRETERLKPIRLERMLNEAEEARQRGEWKTIRRLAEDMQGIEPQNNDAKRLIALCDANLPCQPVYQQAQVAAQRGRWRAVLALMTDIRQTCPDYGDPAGLFLNAIFQETFEWCDISAGQITLDNKQTYQIEPFMLAKYPVTNAQFRLFIDDPNGYQNPMWWDFSEEAKAWRADNHQSQDEQFKGDTFPRVNVCWYEAMAYCRWLSAAFGEDIRLPTEWEWQWAASGKTGYQYPYGNGFDSTKSNTKESGIGQTTPVDSYPQGASPFGVLDMSGNVWEWCLNNEGYNIETLSNNKRVLRGGSWNLVATYSRTTYRDRNFPYIRNLNIGFRLARPYLSTG